jgi:hypothetical protein
LAQLDLAEHILENYQSRVQGSADLVSADTVKVRDVQKELEQQSLGLDAQLRDARAEVDKVFEGMRQRGMSFIDTNLSIRKIGRTPRRDQLQAEFQEVVIGRALRDINDATSGYINAVIDHSRLYWRGIIDRLNQLRQLVEQELSGLDAGAYAEQREGLEEAIRIAEAELKSYSTGKVVTDIQQVFQSNLNGFTAWGTAAVVGLVFVLLEVITKGPLIAGGAAIFPPLIVAATALSGALAWRYYRRVTDQTRRELNERIDRLEKTYHAALDELTRKERNRLTQYGKQVLTPIFSRLDVLAQRYAAQKTALQNHSEQLEALRSGIEASN